MYPEERDLVVGLLRLLTGDDAGDIQAEIHARSDLRMAYRFALGPLVESLSAYGIEHKVVNTGGDNMVVYVRVDSDYSIGFARSEESWDRYESTDPEAVDEIDNDPDGWDIVRQRDDGGGSELLERDASMERVLEVIDGDHAMVSEFTVADLYRDAERAADRFRMTTNELAALALSTSRIETTERVLHPLQCALLDAPGILHKLEEWHRINHGNALDATQAADSMNRISTMSDLADRLLVSIVVAIDESRRIDWRTPGTSTQQSTTLAPPETFNSEAEPSPEDGPAPPAP